ncbi:response regulator [Candidatus Sumerlaeota bacterium]|nr:response regulator [Candidatus Sumerlaeota bacterium]
MNHPQFPLAKVMVVDDVTINLELIAKMLQDQGVRPQIFSCGKLALEAALTDPPDLVLLDIKMPVMDGYEVCERFKSIEKLADIPIIFISANCDTLDKLHAFRCGGVDYITKPFHFEEVQARVRTHLELRQTKLDLIRHNTNLQKLVNEQVRDILSAKEEISAAQLATILAMSKITEARDNATGKHIERTQSYCRILAEEMQQWDGFAEKIDEGFIGNICHASPLHDIGKVAIPDNILRKPGELTDGEFSMMKCHTTIGSATLKTVLDLYPNNGFIKTGMEIAQSHHEKWDGSGYPEGLSGDAIPLAAQIMAVADVYDALRTERCYKCGFSHEKSCEIIVSAIGAHFSPSVGKAFQNVEMEFAQINQKFEDQKAQRQHQHKQVGV